MRLIVILTLSLLGFLIYSNSFNNSFHFDDFHSIANNPAIRDIHHWRDIWSMEPTRFVNFFSFVLNYSWGGLNVQGYHLVNLLLHVGVSILVWCFIRLRPSAHVSWIAFFGALIFLTHPLQTQPVNYIYQRAVLLAAFFYLSSLILFIKAHLIKGENAIKGRFYYAGALGCGFLSFFSKENAVSLPLMIIFYQWFFFGKQGLDWKKILPFFVMLLLIPLAWHPDLALLTELFKDAGQGVTSFQYALTQTKVVLTYLKLLILPFGQRVEYDFTLVPSLLDAAVIGSIFVLLLILGAAVFLSKKFKLMAFGICWFFITLFPESSFWPNKDLVFEHRLYLPLMGFAIFLSSGLFYLFEGKVSVAMRFLVLLVIGYSFLTYQRNKVWLNEFTLWDDAVRQSPKSSRAYLNRGAAYQIRGDLDHALEDYNMVIGLGIVDTVTLSNRGLIFQQKGEFDLALANFNLAIQINPNYAGTYVNRALLYQAQGKADLAFEDFNKAKALLPKK